jgi:hypothetical protein
VPPPVRSGTFLACNLPHWYYGDFLLTPAWPCCRYLQACAARWRAPGSACAPGAELEGAVFRCVSCRQTRFSGHCAGLRPGKAKPQRVISGGLRAAHSMAVPICAADTLVGPVSRRGNAQGSSGRSRRTQGRALDLRSCSADDPRVRVKFDRSSRAYTKRADLNHRCTCPCTLSSPPQRPEAGARCGRRDRGRDQRRGRHDGLPPGR